MGANGHNAAKAALDDAAGISAPQPTVTGRKPPWQQQLVGALMSTRSGRWLSYKAARQPALRKITAYAARVR
jgi:hypothetical protein